MLDHPSPQPPGPLGSWLAASLSVLCALAIAACSESPASRSDGRSLVEAGVDQRTDAVGDDARADGPEVDGPGDASGDASTPPDLGADLGPDAGQPGLVLRVTFDQAALGAYTDSAIRSEWKWIKWHSGLDKGRVFIVDGTHAKSGRSLRISYPKGTYGPSQGGAQWWVTLPKGYDELYCAYWIKFGAGFDFVKGGKIPGLLGGKGNTGGSKPTGKDGWSARMMWRKGGDAVQYLYHPDQPSTWGEDLAWDIGGKRVFKPGTWVRVEHRIVMNTPGKKDGIVEGWWNGTLALSRKNVRFRDVSSFAIDGFYFSTFFGGGDSSWSSSKDEFVYFDDFVIATQPITH